MVTARRSTPSSRKLLGRLPDLGEPAQLLVAVAAVMDFGDRDRNAVALPRLAQPRREAGIVLQPLHPHRLGIDIGVAAVPARLRWSGIKVEPVVEEALAGEIMVDAEQVGRRLRRSRTPPSPPSRSRRRTGCCARLCLAVDAAAEQIEAEPAPLILVRRLVAQRLGREGLAEILGLDELAPRDDASGSRASPRACRGTG